LVVLLSILCLPFVAGCPEPKPAKAPSTASVAVATTRAPRGRTAPRLTDLDSQLRVDLALVRSFNGSQQAASAEIMEAALRVFDQTDFIGLTPEAVEELLGPAVLPKSPARQLTWEYYYHNGESGVVRWLVFDSTGTKVVSVIPIPTQ